MTVEERIYSSSGDMVPEFPATLKVVQFAVEALERSRRTYTAMMGLTAGRCLGNGEAMGTGCAQAWFAAKVRNRAGQGERSGVHVVQFPSGM